MTSGTSPTPRPPRPGARSQNLAPSPGPIGRGRGARYPGDPNLAHDFQGELDSLFVERLKRYHKIKKERAEERVVLKARRDLGLVQRHADKLRRAA